jgi:hypothetical protein
MGSLAQRRGLRIGGARKPELSRLMFRELAESDAVHAVPQIPLFVARPGMRILLAFGPDSPSPS